MPPHHMRAVIRCVQSYTWAYNVIGYILCWLFIVAKKCLH